MNNTSLTNTLTFNRQITKTFKCFIETLNYIFCIVQLNIYKEALHPLMIHEVETKVWRI